MPHTGWSIEKGRAQKIEVSVIDEALVTIYVNGQELATIMCSPLDQEALALGFLYNEGIIHSLAEVGLAQANVPRTAVDVFLRRVEFDPPRRLILTSGCDGGLTLEHLTESYPPLESQFSTTPEIVLQRMRELKAVSPLHNAVGGAHTSALCDQERILISAEDIGRHNTIDKIAGKALQAGATMRDCMLLTSGRISSEMIAKARRMEVPLVASLTTPTGLTLRLAQAWGISVIGYARGNKMTVYTHPRRLGLPE